MNAILGITIWVAVFLATAGAWIQHFITTIQQEMWVLLVVGALAPPVGVLHGWLVWLGVL